MESDQKGNGAEKTLSADLGANPASSEQTPLQGNEMQIRSSKSRRTTGRRSQYLRKLTFFERIRLSVNTVVRRTSAHFSNIIDAIVTYFQGVFTIALVENPISFSRSENFNSAGERIPKKGDEVDDEHTLDMIEAACNYTAETKEMFDMILASRKDNTQIAASGTVDFSKLAPWNESFRDRLESTFQVFDISGDGLVNFEELTTILAEFGDVTSLEDRRKVFDSADVLAKSALNFTEFVTMIHNLTVKAVDKAPPTLVETFRQIDRNMARVRSLDVVQQLQAGLF